MARIDAKRSGITTNIPESVLRRLKSPALGFSWRYRDSSGFPFLLFSLPLPALRRQAGT